MYFALTTTPVPAVGRSGKRRSLREMPSRRRSRASRRRTCGGVVDRAVAVVVAAVTGESKFGGFGRTQVHRRQPSRRMDRRAISVSDSVTATSPFDRSPFHFSDRYKRRSPRRETNDSPVRCEFHGRTFAKFQNARKDYYDRKRRFFPGFSPSRKNFHGTVRECGRDGRSSTRHEKTVGPITSLQVVAVPAASSGCTPR